MMNLSTAGEWIAWAGIVLPLAALAWSAVFYTLARRREVQHQEYQRFFQIMDHLGLSGASIASKMAAAYELRKYPEYTDVIVNICEKAQIEGVAADMLKEEMLATAQYLKALK
ncbi:hypothetical protein [Sphingobium aromaticiconvertens]|uniref:hypothetical protein n=1 Tax=Sphingobium aromaticiconvertens TaxID=365341 RepID=UPI003015AFB5